MRPLVIAGLLLAPLVVGCSPQEPPATITVEYQDSSLPPQFHRSWVLTADEGDLTVAVDSYGDPISEGTATLSDAEWDAFTETVYAELDDIDIPREDSCGGSNALTITLPEEEYEFRGCSEDFTAALEAGLAVVAPLTEAVDLERRTDT